jgi:hypothetical protein
MIKMKAKAFENVKNQISHCAIWCGSCVVGNGTLKELTKRYEHIIVSYGVNKGGAEEQGFNGREFIEMLQSIQNIPICRGCLKGGGATDCKIRACALSKKITDCLTCKDFMKCENKEALGKVRRGALEAGMLFKTEKDETDQKKLIEKWTTEIAAKFPNCSILSEC